MEIEAVGFSIEPHRVVTETVSGSTAVAQRKGIFRLIDKMQKSDILVVAKVDRLGRDAIDVGSTVADLEKMGTSRKTIMYARNAWTCSDGEENRR